MPPVSTLRTVPAAGMTSLTRAFDAQIDSVNTEERSLVARINTNTMDRYRSVIDPKGGRLENYRRNPIALWEHGKDPRRFTDPIGRNVWIRHSGGEKPKEILAKTQFLDDDFSQQRFEWYRDGVLSAFSVHALPDADQSGPPTRDELRARPELEACEVVYRSWELIEYSGTSCPGNPDTLTVGRAASLMQAVNRGLWLPDDVRPLIEEKARTMTDSAPAQAVKPEVVEEDKPNGVDRYIRKKGEKWIVYSESGKVLGEHDDEASAKKQLAAIEANKDRSTPWIDHAPPNYIVRSPDGLPILATLDRSVAVECIEAMARHRPIERTHVDLIQVARQMRDARKLEQQQFREEIIALVDLMVHGRV